MAAPGDFSWRVLGGRELTGRFCVAGVVNVTPDSFFDGGRYAAGEAAVAHGLRLAAEGAAILDVGGESTRPYAEPVPVEEELRRVVPVIRGLAEGLARQGFADVVLSVDTRRAAVAEAALDAGAAIVNDVSACSHDPALLDVLVRRKPGYVLTHSQGDPKTMQDAPDYADVAAEIEAFFREGLARLARAGLPRDRAVLDPGIGFGKTLGHNLEILRSLPRFAGLGRPLFVGLSNKSFLGKLLDRPVEGRGPGTLAALTLAAALGAAIHRVHDVGAARDALALVGAIAPAGLAGAGQGE